MHIATLSVNDQLAASPEWRCVQAAVH